MADYDIYDIYNADPQAPWNQPEVVVCDDCGLEANKTDAGDPPDDWQEIERGRTPGQAGDWIVCPDCAEQWG